MKKAFTKKIVTLLTAFVMAFCSNTMAFATELHLSETSIENAVPANSDRDISSQSNSYEGSGVSVNSSNWTTIATSTNGFGCTVQVNAHGTGKVSIRMLDRSGNTLWSETGALGLAGSRDFYCGTDVYKIQVKCVSGFSNVSCWPIN